MRFAIASVALVAGLAGCGDRATVVPGGPVPGSHVAETADGVAMPYDVHGTGDTTVVLVHCWMCDRTFWDAQIPALEEAGYRVLTLDLPGHGAAGDNRPSWTIEGYGHDVAGLIEELDLERVVLVGHSMGGPVVLKAAALAAGRAVGVVAVDTLHDADFDFSNPEMQQVVSLFEQDFRGTCSLFVDQMFAEDRLDEVVSKLRRTACEEGNAVAGQALIGDFRSLDFPALFRGAGVPIRAINAAAPNETRLETNRKYADFDAVLMEGVGHYLHMTRPEAFNRHLLATVGELSAAR